MIISSKASPLSCHICSIAQVRFRRRVCGVGPYNLVHRFAKEGILDAASVSKIAEAYKNSNYAPRQIKDLPPAGEKYTLNSRRIGLVGIKIGMMPQWDLKGKRILCTAIHLPDNQVVSVTDPFTWYKRSQAGKRKAFSRFGASYKVTVGAQNIEPFLLGSDALKLFKRWGIHPKEHIGSFSVTEDALVQPGTHLDARHFNVGQYVNVAGKTIDWGFQGAMHRWGFRGQPARRTTKAHRRVGSIGSKGDARVWPGKRMPGHMGFEWRQVPGLEVVRINPKENVIFVKGSVPGDNLYPLLINDCMFDDKRVVNPPFPTYLSTIEEADENVEEITNNLKETSISTAPVQEQPIDDKTASLYGYQNIKSSVYDIASKDMYAPNLFNFNSPSIVFTEADEKKSAARDKTRAKIAKVKK